MTEANRPIDVKLRDLCDHLKGARALIDFADIEPLLREAAQHIEDQWAFLRKMDHCIQSTWKCVPDAMREHFANDETIATENRLPSAVAWMSAQLKD